MSEASERLREWLSSNWSGNVSCSDILNVINELDTLKKSHERLSEIYRRRGETIAELRRLLNETS